MQKEEIKELVFELLAKGKEGAYWDFKQEWHADTPDLLKDIICFTNTVHSKDCYIIFGVNDSLEIVGMMKPRRKQADIIDAMDKLEFATVHKPFFTVETIEISKHDIDVLIIYNMDKTPVYLKKQYGKMLAGCIYTRNEDRNTPDNGNADEEQIEYLWKKRFGLTKPAINYILEHLENKLEWNETENEFYNIYHPEYVLRFRDEIEDHFKEEFYGYVQSNEKMCLDIIDIVASNTVIMSHQIARLDSYRLVIPVPEWGFIYSNEPNNEAIAYKYYVEGSDTYKILKFLYNPSNYEERYAYSRHMQVVLLYHSENERSVFEKLVSSRMQEIEQYYIKHKDEITVNAGSDLKSELYKKQILFGICINDMLAEFRSINI